MKWTLKIGRFAGIDVYLHGTFLILIGILAISSGLAKGSVLGAVQGVAYFVSVFFCVLLHEFGHALTARRYGIETRDIILLPIGGVASLERMPEKPSQEFWIAVAGPAVNVAIAALLGLWLWFDRTAESMWGTSLTHGHLAANLFRTNLFLVLFNMIPAFPMDGGRVFRALLASVMDYAKATRLAAVVGRGFALVFAAVGIFFNPMLIFIAFFIWMAGGQESDAVQMRRATAGLQVHHAMMSDFQCLEPHDTLDRAAHLLLQSSQRHFPVVQGPRVVGILERESLLRGLAVHGRHGPVQNCADTSFGTAEPNELLDVVLARMGGSPLAILPVVASGRLVGLLDMENVQEMLLIQRALADADARLTPDGALTRGLA